MCDDKVESQQVEGPSRLPSGQILRRVPVLEILVVRLALELQWEPLLRAMPKSLRTSGLPPTPPPDSVPPDLRTPAHVTCSRTFETLREPSSTFQLRTSVPFPDSDIGLP